MKKSLILASCLFGAVAMAQTHGSHDGHELAEPHFCATVEMENNLLKLHPEWKAQHAEGQAAFQEQADKDWENYSSGDRDIKIVPVVFHIVHLGGEENISDEQIFNAMENLNADFSATNSDIGGTVPAFAGITGNTEFEFKLATKDPSGECHPGITRTYSSTTYDEGMGASGHAIVEAVKSAQGTWPMEMYMNVYVCIDPSGAAGYTYKPGGYMNPYTDDMYWGIFMRHDYTGAIGTSSSGRRHTLSHEAGHWFNLNHTWGNSNSPGDIDNCDINDGVGDTPNTVGWTFCDLDGESCGSLDNVQNIMEYSYCSTMFTEGQSSRMNTAINSSTAGRSNLWSSSNLTATGVVGPGDLCEAQFTSDETIVCAGQSISFEDQSFFNVTSWAWSFEGGTPASSTAANPTVTYNTSGTYNVSLTVSNGTDFESITMNDYITVMNDPGDPLPYFEGFETLSELNDGQRFAVKDEDGLEEWEMTSAASNGGSKSVYLSNYGVDNGSVDELISGPIDLSGVDASEDFIFSFDYVYNKKLAGNNETMKVFISKDCGETWALRLNLDSEDMSSGQSGLPFTPTSDDAWTNEIITTVTSTYFVSNFMYKFEFTNDNGNNVFIDNINLYPASMTNIVEGNAVNNLSVYPNPVSDQLTVEIQTTQSEDYTIELYNAIGEKIGLIYQGPLAIGDNSFDYSTTDLAKGVYVIRVSSQGTNESLKLIKE